MKNKTDEEIKKLLKSLGLKVTPGRIGVARVFYLSSTPLSTEDVWQKMKGQKINLATIYRTITSLETGGVLRRVDLRRDAQYFELSNLTHHHHIICSHCGELEDIHFCNINQVTEKALLESKKFATLLDHSLEFFGICKKCVKKV